MVFDAWDATAVLNREDADDAAADANTEGFSAVSEDSAADDGGVVTVSVGVAAGDVDPKRGCGFIAEIKRV